MTTAAVICTKINVLIYTLIQ